MEDIDSALYVVVVFIFLSTVAFILEKPLTKSGASDEPPQLEETVPFVSNVLNFMIRKQAFVVRLW